MLGGPDVLGHLAGGRSLVAASDRVEQPPVLVVGRFEVQGAMTRLISLIAHPPEVLESANHQHRRLLYAIRRRDEGAAAREMAEHVRATEHILGGLLPVS